MYQTNSVINEQFYNAIAYYRLSKEDGRKSESDSPMIQNGKLVGAVTHVLVDDPTRGYGIFIEDMLAN